MEKMINRTALVRGSEKTEDGKRFAEFVISSEAVDTYGTVFKREGWQLDRYIKNPVVAYNHRTHSDNPDMIIGTSQISFEDDKMIGRVEFDLTNPTAVKIADKVENGVLRMASIGAIPKKGDWGDPDKGEDRNVLYFREQELIEWSIVPVGSNPDAHKRNSEGLEAFKQTLAAREIEVTEPEQIKKSGKSVLEAQIIINKNN